VNGRGSENIVMQSLSFVLNGRARSMSMLRDDMARFGSCIVMYVSVGGGINDSYEQSFQGRIYRAFLRRINRRQWHQGSAAPSQQHGKKTAMKAIQQV
jgi:hypothetical protein